MTSEPLCVDGRLAPRTALPAGIYLYQFIATRDRRPLLAAGHLRLLNESARQWFGPALREWTPAALVRETERLLDELRYPDGSGWIAVRRYASGERIVEAGGIGYGAPLSLRGTRPDALLLRYELDRPSLPTSARLEMRRWARAAARAKGYGCVLQTDSHGELRALDDAPPLVVVHGRLRMPPDFDTPFGELLLRAADEARLPWERRTVGADELAGCDELIALDHRGLISVGSCGGRLLPDFIARRLDEALQRILPKK